MILRRAQGRDGRSRAFINDQPVSVSMLREIGATLIEVHGQHDDRALLDGAAHRRLLDAFGGLGEDVAAVAALFAAWRQAETAVEEQRRRIETARAEADYLRAALEQLTALAPKAGEETELSDRRHRMMRAEKIAEDVTDALETVAGGASPVPVLASVARRLERRRDIAADLVNPAIEAIDRALTALDEAGVALEHARDEAAFDPKELETAEQRLFALRGASRKFDAPIDLLPDLAARIAGDLEALEVGEAKVEELAKAAMRAREEYRNASATLSDSRRRAAAELEAAVAAELPALKLERASFSVAIDTDPGQPTAAGIDQVAFVVRTNPGGRPGPLAKVASGGELSRFLLAIKVALADRGSAPTLIFDEIDTAVGGSVSDAIGVRLSRLAEGVQVLAVTHAPQVAARAAHHWSVAKDQHPAENRMVTSISRLDEGRRREEIARMLAGRVVTDEARAAAERLLAGALERAAQAVS
jgi:DNA repair protein RecN (Recombination protein N)